MKATLKNSQIECRDLSHNFVTTITFLELKFLSWRLEWV